MLHMSGKLLSLSLLLLLAGAVFGEDFVHHKVCEDSVDICTIEEVSVDPCPQAAKNVPCRVRRRHPSYITFKFTPTFDAERLETTLGWAKSETEELPLMSMERDTCKFASCPIKAGVKNTFTTEVPIESKFPLGPYTIRWALTDPVSHKRCCFTIDVKVVR